MMAVDLKLILRLISLFFGTAQTNKPSLLAIRVCSNFVLQTEMKYDCGRMAVGRKLRLLFGGSSS